MSRVPWYMQGLADRIAKWIFWGYIIAAAIVGFLLARSLP